MTTEPLIRNISDTALWVAMYRAWETEQPNPVFRDPHARRLAGARGEEIMSKIKVAHRHAWSYTARTYNIDSFVTQEIANGADTHHEPPQPGLRDGHDVVQVDCTRVLHSIVGAKHDFRCDATDRGGDGSNRNPRKPVDDRVAGEDQHRPLLVGLRKSEEADIAPRYFSGHAVTLSQAANSAGSSGVRS